MTVTTPTPIAAPAHPRTRYLLHVLKWLLCAAVLVAVSMVLVRQFRKVPWSEVRFAPLPFMIATLCIAGNSFAQLFTRWMLLRAYGYHLPWRAQAAISFVPPMGKYLPGGIASLAGALYLLRKHKVPTSVGFSVSMLVDGLSVTAGLILSAPLLLSGPVQEKLPNVWMIATAMIVVGVVLSHPKVFVGLMNFVLARLGREPMGQPPPLRKYIGPILGSFAQWVVAGLGLWFMDRAVVGIDQTTYPGVSLIPLFIASTALTMTAGYLMPFAPGGLGVRELMFIVTIGPVVGAKTAAVVGVAMRVAQTVVEIFLASIGLAMIRQPVDQNNQLTD